MIVITGATGNTGKVAAEELLAAGEAVRVIARRAEKLEPLVRKGAEACQLDIMDSSALAKALQGASAAYLMMPPDVAAPDIRSFQERASDSIAAAVAKAGVPRAVVLSSMGADKSERTGPVLGLHNLEEKMKQIGDVYSLFLRPNYFMENNLAQIELIRRMHSMGGVIRDDLPLSEIATRDIGKVAAEALHKRDFSGHTSRELLGPREITNKEVAGILGAAIGKPNLSYKVVPGFMAKMALQQMGMSSSFVNALLEMSEALNDGWMKPIEPRSPENTMSTTIERFATEVFAPAFNKS